MSDPAEPRFPLPSRADLSGRTLGDFRLLRRLGRGAMAEVYLAEQASLSRHVAVKILKPELAADDTYVKRFQREAQAAAALVHGSIVQIYEVGCVDGRYYIAQEYVQGENLRQWLTRRGPLDLRAAVNVMRQVAAALAKAAEHGIIHRDIKPENILLTRSGEVKVADFGLSRVTGTSDSLALTQVGMTMGTPLYMSPEQAEGRPLDPRSDLYSFGVMCYHMLAGRPPFTGETPLSVAMQHLKKPPPPLENVRGDLPPALCRLVHRMLAKSPEQRHQSAAELLRELRQIQQEHLADQADDHPDWDVIIPASTALARTETTQRLDSLMKTAAIARARRSRPWLWAAAAIGMFLLGAAAARYVTREPPLLARAADAPVRVPKDKRASLQLLRAKEIGTAEAWQAVKAYYPKDTYAVNFADQQLALIYLRQGDDQRAWEIFEKFAHMGEPELQAFGLVGLCAVHTSRRQFAESNRLLLEEVLDIRSSLRDPLMWRILQQVIRTNADHLGVPTSDELKKLLESPVPEAS